MIPIIIVGIVSCNSAALTTIIGVSSVGAASTGVLTTDAIACGATATATVVAGGIIYAIHLPNKNQKKLTEKESNYIFLDTMSAERLLEQTYHFYPITNDINDEANIVLFFENDLTSQEQRFEHLPIILDIFSDNIQKFEAALKENNNQSIKKQEIILRECASNFWQCLQITSQKQKLMPGAHKINEEKLHTTIISFIDLLQKLSVNVSQYKIPTLAFSLAHQIDLICETAHQLPDKSFISFFNSNKLKTFKEDIAFIKEISHHPQCTNKIRMAGLELLNEKKESASIKLGYGIIKLINLGLLCFNNTHRTRENKIVLISDFCHEKNLIPPNQFQIYLNENKRKISNTKSL